MFNNQSGVGLLEAVVGGALLLGAGMMLNEAASKTVTLEKRHDQNFLMRRLMDRSAMEAFRNAQLYYPLNPNLQGEAEFKAYYGCFSKKGVMRENAEGYVEYGITSARLPPKPEGEEEKIHPLYEYDVPQTAYFIKNKVGFSYQGNDLKNATQPCQSKKDEKSFYVAYILPLSSTSGDEVTYRTHLWVFALKGDGSSIIGAMRSHITMAPYI